MQSTSMHPAIDSHLLAPAPPATLNFAYLAHSASLRQREVPGD